MRSGARFCPRCGATDKTLFQGFCMDCYLKDHPTLLTVEDMDLRHCTWCLRVRTGAEWVTARPESIKRAILSKVKTGLDSPSYVVELLRTDPKGNETYSVTVSGEIGGEQISLSKEAKVRYLKETCAVCSRKSGNYYEALVQLRSKGRQIDLDVMDKALNFLRNEMRAFIKRDRNAEIFRFEEVENGLDIQVGSNLAMKAAMHRFRSKFNATIKESYTLHGRNNLTSKDIYRVTYSVRI